MRSHKKFWPERFSRFDVYWVQTDKQSIYTYRYQLLRTHKFRCAWLVRQKQRSFSNPFFETLWRELKIWNDDRINLKTAKTIRPNNNMFEGKVYGRIRQICFRKILIFKKVKNCHFFKLKFTNNNKSVMKSGNYYCKLRTIHTCINTYYAVLYL